MMENFPNLMREKVTQIQETQRVPNKMNPKRTTPRHITIQINDLEHKEEISIQSEQQEEKRIQKNKGNMRSLWDISKCTNI